MRIMRPQMIVIGVLTLLLSGIVYGQDATPAPTVEPTQQVLSIWWPDALLPPDNTPLQELITQQTDAFIADQTNVQVDSRLKRVGTLGGIMSTLRAGSLVAESALPTITLIRRDDLITAERNGLIQSMEGLIPSSIQGELDTTLSLGQINGELYGLPYMIELDHFVYDPAHADVPTWDNILEQSTMFAFPGANESNFGEALLLQYLISGGQVPTENPPSWNQTALESNLAFYENATEQGLIAEELLDHTSSDAYIEDFLAGTYQAGLFTSTQYLKMLEDHGELGAYGIPGSEGETGTLLDGWIWILITPDRDQQTLAIKYIQWMMTPNRQAQVAKSIHMLPSQQSALEPSLPEGADATLFLTLLDTAMVPENSDESNALTRTLQTTVMAIIRGEQTVEEAIATILNQQND